MDAAIWQFFYREIAADCLKYFYSRIIKIENLTYKTEKSFSPICFARTYIRAAF